jgi:metallo-beta-lactamase family protein
MKEADRLAATDYLVCESTYGDRRHPADDIEESIAEIVQETVERGGVLLVPAFAVGRAQHLLHILARLMSEGRIPKLPVFLDSPMAINATRIFRKHAIEHRLTREECERMCNGATYTETADESKSIAGLSGPMVVISASGMATGGRVLHHLKNYLPDEKNTVLVVGYQAGGTRGRTLAEGAREVKIHGQYIAVRAQVRQVHGLSAHADFRELLDWLSASKISPKKVFVTHGEPAASDVFRRRLRDDLGFEAVVPEDGTEWTLQ